MFQGRMYQNVSALVQKDLAERQVPCALAQTQYFVRCNIQVGPNEKFLFHGFPSSSLGISTRQQCVVTAPRSNARGTRFFLRTLALEKKNRIRQVFAPGKKQRKITSHKTLKGITRLLCGFET
jgi:hypothetical protein